MRISRRMGLYIKKRELILYDAGTEHSGGIGAYAYAHAESYSTRRAPTISRGTSSLTVSGGTTIRAAGSVFVEEKIDTTKYSTLKINISSFSVTQTLNMFVVATKADNYSSVGGKVGITGTGEWSIDLSSINGAYYIVLVLDGTSNNYFTITKWWLE